MASEHSMRKLSIQQSGTNLAAEAMPFSVHVKDNIDLSPRPMVYIPDLGEKVFQLLDQNERLHNMHAVKSQVILHFTVHTA